MRSLRLLVLLLVALVAVVGGSGDAAARSVAWERFDVSLTLNDDGTYHVVERQQVHFTDGPFSFAFAEIPTDRLEDIANVSVSEERGGDVVPYAEVGATRNDEDPETYVVEPGRDAVTITWYMPRTVDETRVFVLEYDVVGNLRVYADEAGNPRQQIWWTAISEEVTAIAPVEEATFTVELPTAVDLASVILSGPGDDEPAEHSTDGRTFTWSESDLGDGDSLEARLEFPSIVAAEAPAWQQADDDRRIREEEVEGRRTLINVIVFAAGLLTLTAGGVGLYGLWYTRGRDPGVGAVASYLATPPDNLAPGAAGALIDEVVHPHDVIATLVDLGHRGVVTIKDEQTEHLGGIFSSHDFVVTMTDKQVELKPFEQTLLRSLFGEPKAGSSVRLSAAKQRFNAHADTIRDQLYDELVRNGYFAKSPEATRSSFKTAGCLITAGGLVALFFLTAALFEWTDVAFIPFVAVALIGVALVVISGAMPKKSAKGAEDAAKWRAFKRYLDDIEQYENVEEAKEIFQRYLPYAIAFGIERGFVTKFAAVGAEAPEWFGGGAAGSPNWGGGYGRRRGGTVVIGNWGGGWGGGSSGGGAFGGGGGRSGGGDGGGGFDLPDLQSSSDKGLGSLQSLSGGLFDLLTEAGSAFGSFSGGGGGGRSGGFSGGGRSGGGGGGGGRGFG